MLRILKINYEKGCKVLVKWFFDEGVEYQLTSEVKGTPTYKVQPNERNDAVKVLGETLKMIH